MRLDIRYIAWLCIAVALISGCKLQDENAEWNPPTDSPPWIFDAPFYYRPTNESQPVESIGKGIDVYYSRTNHFFVKHPGGCQLTGAPRVAVWFSIDAGKNWETAGNFGVEQTHFMFLAEQDARHWVRFVGPGQEVTAKGPVPLPHRVYVVDTQAPDIAIAIRPSPWDDEEKKVPHIYKAGDEISVGWAVRDANLKPGSIKLESCIGKVPFQLSWGRFRGSLPPTGRKVVTIPVDATYEGAIRFRIEAEDKAGNVSAVMSPNLHVMKSDKADARPAGARPAGDFTADAPKKPKRPGWPDAGSLFRAGDKIKLEWTPEIAKDFKNIKLEATSNDKLTWTTLAKDVKHGTTAIWTVPDWSSRFCRVRLVSVGATGELTLLAQSGIFRVAKIYDDTKVGPKKLKTD